DLSEWFDEANSQLPPDAATWARLAKITEEAGEVVAAHSGATGQYPRKGVTHTRADVEEELLDVALTALAALEHLRGHDARSLELLADRLEATLRRAEAGGCEARILPSCGETLWLRSSVAVRTGSAR